MYDKVVSYPNPSDWAEGRSLEIPKWCQSSWSDAGEREHEHPRVQVERLRDIAGIISSFDNTPRRNVEDANLFASGDPKVIVERFRKSLHAALYYESCCFQDALSFKNKSLQSGNKNEHQDKDNDNGENDDRFIIINAMNEWAEGMALEPSDVYGRSFLETIRDTKLKIREDGCSV